MGHHLPQVSTVTLTIYLVYYNFNIDYRLFSVYRNFNTTSVFSAMSTVTLTMGYTEFITTSA